MRDWLQRMPAKCRNQIIELLKYPENTVGGVMINNIISIDAAITGKEGKALVEEKLRTVDFGSMIFLIDEANDRRLRGAVSLRDLLISGDDRALEQIMDPYLETLSPYNSATDAAYKIVDGQVSAMPVVDNDGRLLGAVTIDAAISQLVPAGSGIQSLRVFS